MNNIRWLACLVVCVSVSWANAQEKKKPLAIEDLYLMENVRSPVLFPKGDKLVYERVWIDPKTKEERHSLWLVEGKRENRKPLEEGELDGRSPVVSPDGEWIAFLSTRTTMNSIFPRNSPPVPPYSDAGVDVWLYHVKTREVHEVVGRIRPWGRVFHDGFYGRVAFSPDSKRLAIVADDGKDPRSKEEIEVGVEIVRPDQGEGYTGYGPAQIWIAEVQLPDGRGPSKFVRLTDDDIWYGDPQWSPDGKSLVVVANKSKDRESVRFSINKNFDLYLIDIASKKQTQLTTNPGPDVSPRWSPDGKHIAYLSSPRKGPHRDVFDVYLLSRHEAQWKSQLALNLHNAPEKSNDREYAAAFPMLDRCWTDNRQFYVRLEAGTTNLVYYVNLPINETKLIRGHVEAPFSPQLKAILPGEDPILNERNLSGTRRVIWNNDKMVLDGLLTTPNFDVAKPPHKLIVYPHGGPHSRSTLGFDFTVQLFAAHGYAVFQPNFRGSSGYGKKFLDADRLDLGGGDMRDILTGIDKLVKDGLVDPKRQFVYGISYGGFMTSWLVGHTHQFRAAVAQNAVTDMNMMYGLSDLQSWTTWELGGLPWEQPERYAKHSPITYANKIKTPTLILHARDDRRCPLPMGKAFHQALLANGVPTQMVIYPNEGHGIRQPRHREDVYRRVLAWFEKHDH